MIPDYLPDCLDSVLWLIEPTITTLQLIAYGGLTLVAALAIIGSYLEDREEHLDVAPEATKRRRLNRGADLD